MLVRMGTEPFGEDVPVAEGSRLFIAQQHDVFVFGGFEYFCEFFKYFGLVPVQLRGRSFRPCVAARGLSSLASLPRIRRLCGNSQGRCC